MDHRLSLAALLVVTAAACGARVDIFNNGEGGSVNVGGAGGSGPGPVTGPGVGPGSGPGSTGSGAGSTVGSGPGTTGSGAGGSGPGSSVVTSVGSGPGSSTGTGTMICPSYGDACTSCIASSCPSTWCDCRNDKDCIALLTCFNNCGNNMGCQEMCQTAHPNAISEVYLVADCAGSFCPMQCPGNMPLDPCSKCLLQDCSQVLNTCEADPVCLTLYECLGKCGSVNLTCQQACYAQASMSATAELQKLLECEESTCLNQCQ